MRQRLIDANKLMPNAEVKGQNDLVSARDIANAPTVEAIPVEWIKKFIEDNTFTAVNPKYDGCHFTEEPVDYCVKFRQYQVERMLAIWEKENGK